MLGNVFLLPDGNEDTPKPLGKCYSRNSDKLWLVTCFYSRKRVEYIL